VPGTLPHEPRIRRYLAPEAETERRYGPISEVAPRQAYSIRSDRTPKNDLLRRILSRLSILPCTASLSARSGRQRTGGAGGDNDSDDVSGTGLRAGTAAGRGGGGEIL
jgi:hypothetical protein